MSKLLIPEEPLQVLPTLAKAIGINEAIILQQIHYWLSKKLHYYDGRYWTYNTYEDWAKQFSWIHKSTIQRIVLRLEELGLLISNNYNNDLYDKTKWYSINYEVLDSYQEVDVSKQDTPQNEKMGNTKISLSTNTENNSKTNTGLFLELLPDKLNNEKFVESWREWIAYHREKRRKITKQTAIKQFKMLSQQPDSIGCINRSIENGWQGLFPINMANKNKQPTLGEYVTYDEILKFTQNESAEFRKSIFDKYEALGNGKFRLKK